LYKDTPKVEAALRAASTFGFYILKYLATATEATKKALAEQMLFLL